MESKHHILPSSFRDHDGFLFKDDDRLLRQVNQSYREHYEYLKSCKLYDQLVATHEMVSHQEVDHPGFKPEVCAKVLEPKRISFISYPYEWCFSQLKDAALHTLCLQKKALAYGMTLKDASAFNIQFVDGKPILIDSLSFAKYSSGEPWVAYRQFCEHFLAPLTLAAYGDARAIRTLQVHLDGIPLSYAVRFLPKRTRLNLPLFIHLHAHAGAQTHWKAPAERAGRKVSLRSLRALIENLENCIQGVRLQRKSGHWRDYYQSLHNYTDSALEEKKRLLREWVERVKPQTAWDLGANTGLFSRILADGGTETVSYDMDHDCVEANYHHVVKKKEKRILPLVMDLMNPSPALGWNHEERDAWMDRLPTDLVLVFALIHHLVLGNHLSFAQVRTFLARMGTWLVIEFVPKDDANAEKLLEMQKDVFDDYTQASFEAEFARAYEIVDKKEIPGTKRVVYLMKRK